MKKLFFIFLMILSVFSICYAGWDEGSTGGFINGSDITVGNLTVTSKAGIGNTAPVGLLTVGTNPAIPGLAVFANGSVGFGTTNPSRRLTVNGAARFGTGVDTITISDNQIDGVLFDFVNSYTNTFAMASATNTTIRGRFGFQISPVVPFDINDLAAFRSLVGIGITDPVGRLQVGTSPTAPGLIVTTTNRVGIGTTSPTTPLTILCANTAPANNLFIKAATTAVASRLIISQADGGCSSCGVDAAGTTWACIDVTCP